jgi:tetratricopeptide (TPR) repeat protein
MAFIPTGLATAKGSAHQELRAVATSRSATETSLTAAYQTAVMSRPAYGPTHLAAALGYARLGNETRAQRSLNLAHDFDHWNPAPLLVDARRKRQAGKTQDSLSAYREALRLATYTRGPGRDAITAEIAQQFTDPADIASALPLENSEVWDRLLGSLASTGRTDLAADLAEILAAQTESPAARRTALTWVAQMAAAKGDWDRARAVALPLVAESGVPSAHVVLVRASLHAGDVTSALTYADAGRKAYPKDAELMFVSAEILIERRDELDIRKDPRAWRDRVEPLMVSLKPHAIRHPDPRNRYYMLSGAYNAGRGQLPAAISDYRKAAEAKPSQSEPLVRLAGLLDQNRQLRDAVEIYSLVLDRFPSHPSAPLFAVRLVKLQERLDTLDRFRSSGLPPTGN